MARTTMAQRRRRPESASSADVPPSALSPTPEPLTLTWSLQRDAPIVDALFGTLDFGIGREQATLENYPRAIPAGVYSVTLTESDRAKRGVLWSPSADHRLPLLEPVPGRAGIRIHALNDPREADGCIGVGERNGDLGLLASRDALIRIVNMLRQAEACGDRVELEVLDPVPVWDGATERRVADRRAPDDRRVEDRRAAS